MQRAIGYYKQALGVMREGGDLEGIARTSFKMAELYNRQDEVAQAMPLAREAAEIWVRIGSPNAELAKQLLARTQIPVQAREEFRKDIDEILGQRKEDPSDSKD
jgi:succinyl-CoA synthetase beta subunit